MLALQGLSRQFGGMRAVDNVNLEVEPGEVRAIIGPNGAGKTTLFNLISGAIPPSSGRVFFEGHDITGRSPQYIFRSGIVRSFQISTLFGKLTVRDNVEVLAAGRARMTGAPWSKSDMSQAGVQCLIDESLERVGLAKRGHELCDTLSHGDRRLVEIAMVLAARPKLVLLDEPTAGMSPDETKETAELVHSLAPQVAVLIVEHDMSVVMTICDRITVLHRGAVLADGTPQEIRRNADVQSVYFGKKVH
jgi:branched-chain amino acid transport system ATP-binding protein